MCSLFRLSSPWGLKWSQGRLHLAKTSNSNLEKHGIHIMVIDDPNLDRIIGFVIIPTRF